MATSLPVLTGCWTEGLGISLGEAITADAEQIGFLMVISRGRTLTSLLREAGAIAAPRENLKWHPGQKGQGLLGAGCRADTRPTPA